MAKTLKQNDNSFHTGQIGGELLTARGGPDFIGHLDHSSAHELELSQSVYDELRRLSPPAHELPSSIHSGLCPENVPSSSNSNSVAFASNAGASQGSLLPVPSGGSRSHKKNAKPPSSSFKKKKKSFRINIEDLILKDSAFQQSNARWQMDRLKYKKQQSAVMWQPGPAHALNSSLSRLEMSSSSGHLVKIQEQFDKTSSEEGYSFRQQIAAVNTSKVAERQSMFQPQGAKFAQVRLQVLTGLDAPQQQQNVSQLSEDALGQQGRTTDRNNQSLQLVNGTLMTAGERSSSNNASQQSQMLTIRGKKFKRRSDFQSESSLNQILEQRSRISVNGSHGKVEIKVSTNAANVLNRSSLNRCVALNKRLQYDVQVNQFEAKPRGSLSAASNQMNENKESCDSEAQKSSKRSKQMNQSEFDNIEDYIDDQEECGSEQKAIRFSIRCLDFQMMMPGPNEQRPTLIQQFEQTLTDKDQLLFHGQEARHSLLSRASSLMMSSSIKKQFNLTSNQALPLQLSLFPMPLNTLLQQKQICTPQNSSTAKILPDSKKSVPNTSSSQINMTNIDEKEEMQSVTQKNEVEGVPESLHAASPAAGAASRIARVHQCSNLSNYNMQTFFTPSQASKKNKVNKNFESLSASCNVFDKQRGQSAAVPRLQPSTINKTIDNKEAEAKANSPGASVLHDYTAKQLQARSKSQNQVAQNSMWTWSKRQMMFQPAESKERDTTVVIDEEEEPEDEGQAAVSAEKSRFDFSSVAYGEKERPGQLTGQTLSNSRSQWQTTATMSKNKLNEKARHFLAPKMQGTAVFCEDGNQEGNDNTLLYDYMFQDDREMDRTDQLFQETEGVAKQHTTPKVSQFFGRKSMTSHELLETAGQAVGAPEDKTSSGTQVKQVDVNNLSPKRSMRSAGYSQRSPKSRGSNKSTELKNLSNFRETRERQLESNEKQPEASAFQSSPLQKPMAQPAPFSGFQVTPIKQQQKLDTSQLGKSAGSPPESSGLPRRAPSVPQSTTSKKDRKSTHKKRRTAQKKTVNLSITDLQQMAVTEDVAGEAAGESWHHRSYGGHAEQESPENPNIRRQMHGVEATNSTEAEVRRPLALEASTRPTLVGFEELHGQRELSRKRSVSNKSYLPSSDRTTGNEAHQQKGEPLINKQVASVVSQFEEIDALKMKRIDSEKEPKHNSSLLDVQATANSKEANILHQFVTKVPKYQSTLEDQSSHSQFSKPPSKSSQDLHHQHFMQTINQLKFIKQHMRLVPESEVLPHCVELPPPRDPENQKKLLIFDMDETLIHCVDDVEKQDSDIVLEIKFPDVDEDETVYAGINIRPYIIDCLKEASKHYQVIVFTASHKVYADAILDFIDPDGSLIQHRLYRHNCILTTSECTPSSNSAAVGSGFYIKDLRILQNSQFALKDIVIVDNSVYSFAFQIDNGIPIVPFYDDKEDEEMLHLIYYLNCLAQVEDVRIQNRQAFELSFLGEASSAREEPGAANEEGDVEQDEASHQMAKSFFDQNDQYHKIEECDQNQEETQSDMGGGNGEEMSPQQVQSFGGDEGGMFQVNTDEQDDCETEIAANFDLKADQQQNDKEMESRPREREQSAFRSLKNIYRNLIDEEDIIIEEGSRDGISASKTNTASISDIQILKHHSNYSNNTGQEIKKLVKLIRNNSFSSQQMKDSQCSHDKLDGFSLTAQSVGQKVLECNTCSAKESASGQQSVLNKASHGKQGHVCHGLSAGGSRNDEPVLTFRTRSNMDMLGSPKNIPQASSFGSFAMPLAQEEYWGNKTLPSAESFLKQATPCRPKDVRVVNSAAPAVKKDEDADPLPVRPYRNYPIALKRQERNDNKEVAANVVQMSINLVRHDEERSDRDQMIESFDQFFKTSEKTRQLRGIRDARSATPMLEQRTLLEHCQLPRSSEDIKFEEAERARNPEQMQTPSSRVSPMPVGQSQSRSNHMVSPKSIRSRRSRRNRVATRRNREDGGAGGQHGSSPSVNTSQSQNYTNMHEDSFRAATQMQAPLVNDCALRPHLARHPHQRRFAHTSMSYAPRMDLHTMVPGGDQQQQALSPGLISFYGCQTHPTETLNQSPQLHISAREPELSPR